MSYYWKLDQLLKLTVLYARELFLIQKHSRRQNTKWIFVAVTWHIIFKKSKHIINITYEWKLAAGRIEFQSYYVLSTKPKPFPWSVSYFNFLLHICIIKTSKRKESFPFDSEIDEEPIVTDATSKSWFSIIIITRYNSHLRSKLPKKHFSNFVVM